MCPNDEYLWEQNEFVRIGYVNCYFQMLNKHFLKNFICNRANLNILLKYNFFTL